MAACLSTGAPKAHSHTRCGHPAYSLGAQSPYPLATGEDNYTAADLQGREATQTGSTATVAGLRTAVAQQIIRPSDETRRAVQARHEAALGAGL